MVSSYINAKGANNIEYGSPHSVLYQSIFQQSKILACRGNRTIIPMPKYAKLWHLGITFIKQMHSCPYIEWPKADTVYHMFKTFEKEI